MMEKIILFCVYTKSLQITFYEIHFGAGDCSGLCLTLAMKKEKVVSVCLHFSQLQPPAASSSRSTFSLFFGDIIFLRLVLPSCSIKVCI